MINQAYYTDVALPYPHPGEQWRSETACTKTTPKYNEAHSICTMRQAWIHYRALMNGYEWGAYTCTYVAALTQEWESFFMGPWGAFSSGATASPPFLWQHFVTPYKHWAKPRSSGHRVLLVIGMGSFDWSKNINLVLEVRIVDESSGVIFLQIAEDMLCTLWKINTKLEFTGKFLQLCEKWELFNRGKQIKHYA